MVALPRCRGGGLGDSVVCRAGKTPPLIPVTPDTDNDGRVASPELRIIKSVSRNPKAEPRSLPWLSSAAMHETTPGIVSVLRSNGSICHAQRRVSHAARRRGALCAAACVGLVSSHTGCHSLQGPFGTEHSESVGMYDSITAAPTSYAGQLRGARREGERLDLVILGHGVKGIQHMLPAQDS